MSEYQQHVTEVIEEAIEDGAYSDSEIEVIIASINNMNQMSLSCDYC